MASVPKSVRLKIDRANHHIRDLASQIIAFGESRPYESRHDRNPNTRCIECTLTKVGELPDPLSTITGDVIHNLRSALDHIAYLLCISRSGCKGSSVYFPISEDALKYEAEAPRKIKGMRQDAVKAINRIEPYGGGAGDILWRLHALDNADKHRLLVPILARYTSFQIAPIFDALFKKLPPDFPLKPKFPESLYLDVERPVEMKVGQVLFCSEPDAEPYDNMKFRTEIAFDEPGIIEGKPVIPTLQEMLNFVENVVTKLSMLL
jgi:hypothetical protein